MEIEYEDTFFVRIILIGMKSSFWRTREFKTKLWKPQQYFKATILFPFFLKR